MGIKSKILLLIIVIIILMGLYNRHGKRRLTEPEKGSNDSDVGFRVKKITIVKDYGKSVDWSHANNLIVTAMLGDDGYYDVVVFDPDGDWEQCLTCGKDEIPQKHIGNPAWHPSGKYIVFTAEKQDVPDILDRITRATVPGRGLYHDLYIMTAEGDKFWKLYSSSSFPSEFNNAIIHPQFSSDGKLLVWVERLGPDDDPRHDWGEWALRVADFEIVDGTPKISNIRTFQPGDQDQFYESHAFTHNDSRILFSGNLIVGQLPTGMDIYEYSLVDGTLYRLTYTFDDWDEHAHYSPDGTAIAWISSRGFEIEYRDYDRWEQDLIAELWIMKADGSYKTRLTHFNDPSYPEYTGGRTIVADSSWSPDGNRLIVCITYEDKRGNLAYRKLVMVELEFIDSTLNSTSTLQHRFLSHLTGFEFTFPLLHLETLGSQGVLRSGIHVNL